MVSVPSFILKRLYVKGSLHNTGAGFAFDVLNKLGSGYARQMLPVTVDGAAQELDRTFFRSGDAPPVSFSQVDDRLPFTLEMGRSIAISVDGPTLSAGTHRIGMGFVVQGIGELKFEVADIL